MQVVAMQVDLHDAKTHLSRYVAQAMGGEEVVIARAGRPLVRLVPVAQESQTRRLGFLVGSSRVDVDIKDAFAADIAAMFETDGKAQEPH